jgi:transposase InsO family protein
LVGIQTLCGLFGKSRQAWYEAQKRDEKEDFQALTLLSEVRRLRIDLPSVGVDVLHYQLTEFRQQHGIKVGRDKLANLLRDSHLLIKRKKRRVSTTWSHHRFFKYPNLTVGQRVSVPNRLWVSDITYLLIARGFVYLSLITDAYSRKIVGWAVEESLGACGPLNALRMALKGNKGRLSSELIHHSDRGVQYCCNEYIALLKGHKIAVSMTEQGDPYENALAERMNRTIKEEMLLNRGFADYTSAKAAVERAIGNYNTLRPHGSCNYYTPEQAHQMEGELGRKWRKAPGGKAGRVQPTNRLAVSQNEF